MAVSLGGKGYPIAAVASYSIASAESLADAVGGCKVSSCAQEVADVADVVFVTTPDDVIASVVEAVKWHLGQSVVHCSGAAPLSILEPAKLASAYVGGFHPLQTFASISCAVESISGITFALEAEEPLLSTLKEFATVIGGHWVRLKMEDKVLYHAAAVMVSNYMVTLMKLATDMWEEFGVDNDEASRALVPLLKGTVDNVANIGLPNCLTGPIARGDVGTVKKHLNVLEGRGSSLLSVYCSLGLETLPIARAKGKIERSEAEEIHSLLSDALASKAS
ncbi:MAG: DUF2520 domain-containing protein [Dehalococcoidia bacterium]|nr:DUF2520 domain-containing protein [Dehalococcoidia bacterium]